jgi:hypothetical protein
MKKIVCPSCGKVNFEAFVTFPQCAECGALLPDAQELEPQSFWRRPVGTLWWISLLGAAAVAVAVAVTLLGHAEIEQDQLLVYGILQRHLHVGSQTVMQLTLDTVSEGNVLRKPTLENVELRIPHELLKSWTLVSMEPPPKSIYKRGNGTYYRLGDLEVNTVIFLTWRAREAGDYRFTLNIFADNHEPVRFVAAAKVDKEKIQNLPQPGNSLH